MQKLYIARRAAAVLFFGTLLLNASTMRLDARMPCSEALVGGCYEQLVAGGGNTAELATQACYSHDCADICEDWVYCPDWWGEGAPAYCEPGEESKPGSGFYVAFGYCECHDIPPVPPLAAK